MVLHETPSRRFYGGARRAREARLHARGPARDPGDRGGVRLESSDDEGERSASDAAAVSALVNRAYEHWVPIVGGRPRPMDDDYRVRLTEFESWVDDEDGVIRGAILLEDPEDHLWVDNVAVDPDSPGGGHRQALLDSRCRRATRAQALKRSTSSPTS